jgi:hypothetical protein
MRLKLAGLMRYDWKAEGFSWNERERGIWEKDAVHCELGKTLEKVEEVCKYPFKGADLDVLLEKAGPWAVRTYFEQVKGLRLATPYGELRTLRRDVKDSGKRFVITSTPEGKVVSIKRNWNLGRYDFYIRKKRAMERARTRRALRPEVIAANHARSLRSFAKKIRRPLWRLFKLSEKAKRAADGIQSGEKLVYWNAVATALEIEKREHFRFLRDIIETLPRQMQASGLNDYIAAPWLADFREYLSRTKAACETGAATPSQIEEENAKQTTKKGEESTPKQPPRNRMIARCAPFASGKWRISQPVFCVVGYTGQFGQLESQTPAVAELAQLTRSHIAAALATQANVDAAPIRASAQAPARKTLPGSHYPHNSQGGGDDFAPEPEFWAFEALELAELAGRN